MLQPTLSTEVAAPDVREPASSRWRGWIAWLVLVHALIAGVFIVNRPIAPRPESAPVGEFSEARALEVLDHLTHHIGLRLSGTPNAERAAQYLADQLRALPGVEVDVQRVSAAHHLHGTFVPWPVIRYRVTNVVARIPGRTREAVLLNAHFDTLGDSPGAGDDGIGIASVLETARALAAGPQLEHSVIILCNGGEEYGLYGADGFIRKHPLARDVRAYLYIDGGPGGAATLLYSGPGTGSLVSAYGRAAPRPQADSAYLDLIESGLLSHDGDHRPFREHGVPGLVLATIGDLWAPHTRLDRFSRLEPGSLQHVGQTMLEVARTLAQGPLPSGIQPQRSIYFDVFGSWVVRYSATAGRWLGVLCGLLGAWSVLLALQRRIAAARGVLHAFVAALGGGLAALLGPVCVGLALAYPLRRAYGWYSTPWVAYVELVVPACACFIAAWSGMRARRRDSAALWSTWTSSVIGWTLLALWAAFSDARSGYVPLCWSLGLSLGLLAALRWPAQRRGILLAACAPGLYTIAHFGPMLRTMLAQAGMQLLPIANDPVIGALCGLMVAAAGSAIALATDAFGTGRGVWKPLSGVLIFAVVVGAVFTPFSAERPRRVLVTQAETGGRSAFLFRARDVLPLEPVLERVAGVRAARADWPSFEIYEPMPTHEVPGPPPSFGPPRIEVVSNTTHPDGTRTVELRVLAQTPTVRLFVERGRVASWSVHPEVAEPPLAGGRAAIYYQGFDPAGEPLTLQLRGHQPAEIEVIASTFEPSPELMQVTAAFPEWALPVPLCARSLKQRI